MTAELGRGVLSDCYAFQIVEMVADSLERQSAKACCIDDSILHQTMPRPLTVTVSYVTMSVNAAAFAVAICGSPNKSMCV